MVRHAKAANTTLRYAKENCIALTYRNGAIALASYTDVGAIGKCRDNRSQGGRLFALTNIVGDRVSGWTH